MSDEPKITLISGKKRALFEPNTAPNIYDDGKDLVICEGAVPKGYRLVGYLFAHHPHMGDREGQFNFVIQPTKNCVKYKILAVLSSKVTRHNPVSSREEWFGQDKSLLIERLQENGKGEFESKGTLELQVKNGDHTFES